MRWISSRKRTSPSWREERIAARSPACWMAGPRGDADRGVHLGGDDHREGGLAEAGRAGEQHVVGGGAARAGGPQHQVELLADLLLADELAQVLGAQRGLDGLVLAVGVRARRAARRRPVGGHRRPGSCSMRGCRAGSRSAGPVQGLQGGLQQLADLRRVRGGLGLRGDRGDRLVGLPGRVAEADQRGVQLVAPAAVTGAPGAGRRRASGRAEPVLELQQRASGRPSCRCRARRSAPSRPRWRRRAAARPACARRAWPGRAGDRPRWRSGAVRRPAARRRPRSRTGSASPPGR